MLINLASFYWRSKTKFWSRKACGQEGSPEQRNYKIEVIPFKAQTWGVWWGETQTISPVSTWRRHTFCSLYFLHLLSWWQASKQAQRRKIGRWQGITKGPTTTIYTHALFLPQKLFLDILNSWSKGLLSSLYCVPCAISNCLLSPYSFLFVCLKWSEPKAVLGFCIFWSCCTSNITSLQQRWVLAALLDLQHTERTDSPPHVFSKEFFPPILRIMQEAQAEPSYILQRPLLISF